ncbi:transglutaminase family protein [Phormidium sp. CCY1219]|uniref:transglutaminase family protein n=1 Tax=Phormidium sp. CCY1219 TaxID=2886104 RepID=UPI002D1E4F7A|nr:transglutaminase family protein [Phormidium sp. CCY1219]MEB3829284.1 transglutaminase family protein [Phormidium sp. CCY1219]
MRYQIVHETIYSYSRPVKLEPHTIRLRSRTDATQALRFFSLEIYPEPAGISDIIDLEGNNLIRVWFKQETSRLQILVRSEVETLRSNPFNYLLESWATKLPIDYPASLLVKLQHYFQPLGTPTPIDPVVTSLAQEIWQEVEGETEAFVTAANQRIHENCKHQFREKGSPLPPALTWTGKKGSCRDLTVLFMELCRAMGLAARFVSGYQEGSSNLRTRYLHGWAEVYLPGAGWRGFDPSQGKPVSDRHVALVANPIQKHTTPIYGTFRGTGVQSEMTVNLSINPVEKF